MVKKIRQKLLKALLKINGKTIEINSVRKCRSLKKISGLMFCNKESSPALLFEFSGEVNKAIHSLFCPPFLAIWLNKDNKIIEYKIVSPSSISVKPSKPFSKLIEVPLNTRYSKVIDFILENGKV